MGGSLSLSGLSIGGGVRNDGGRIRMTDVRVHNLPTRAF
jgi:hypothetical protein